MKMQIEQAIKDLLNGKMVVIADDIHRENESDLVIAAEKISPKDVAFMVQHTSGILCVPMLTKDLTRLCLPQMVCHNTEAHHTAFTTSVDYKHHITTGISAHDRALTIKNLANPSAEAHDFARPGHIFPLQYQEGGVLQRAGHTEASIDLLKMGGSYPAATIAELVDHNSCPLDRTAAQQFAEKHQLTYVTVSEIITYRKHHENLVEKVSEATLSTTWGEFLVIVYRCCITLQEHVVFIKGDPHKKTPLVRIHSECLTGDIFHSISCDCGNQLNLAMELIAQEDGIFIYLKGQEGRGIGLGNKIHTYFLQKSGYDTVDANLALGFSPDNRTYDSAAHILRELQISTISLLTNNPEKSHTLETYGITIENRIPLLSPLTKENRFYLQTKQTKLGHLFPDGYFQGTSYEEH